MRRSIWLIWIERNLALILWDKLLTLYTRTSFQIRERESNRRWFFLWIFWGRFCYRFLSFLSRSLMLIKKSFWRLLVIFQFIQIWVIKSWSIWQLLFWTSLLSLEIGLTKEVYIWPVLFCSFSKGFREWLLVIFSYRNCTRLLMRFLVWFLILRIRISSY